MVEMQNGPATLKMVQKFLTKCSITLSYEPGITQVYAQNKRKYMPKYLTTNAHKSFNYNNLI